MKEFEINVITSIEDFYLLKQDWARLLDSVHSHPLFCSWDWLYQWWMTYSQPQDRLTILTISKHEEIISIAPFYLKKARFLKELRFIGTGEKEVDEVCTECLDIICDESMKNTVAEMSVIWLKAHYRLWDIIYFVDVLESSIIMESVLPSLRKSLPMNIQQTGVRYLLPILTGERKTNSSSSKYLKSLVRKRNKLSQLGEISTFRVEKLEELEPAFKILINLHQKRWKDRGHKGVFSSEKFLQFHRQISSLFFLKNSLTFNILKVNNEAVAALYNFRINSTEYFYQSGFDHNFAKKLSIGALMHLNAIEVATYDDLNYYDFMRGPSDSYKSRFGCQQEQMLSLTCYGLSFPGKFLFSLKRAKKLLLRFRDK